MAKDVEDQVADALEDAESPSGGGSGTKLFLLLAVAAVLAGAGGGYGASRLLRGSPAAPPGAGGSPAAGGGADASAAGAPAAEKPDGDDLEYYDFETITVNLNEPRLARYIRATVTLALAPDNADEAKAEIQKRLPELRSELTVYLSGCTLEDVRGKTNLNRIRREILDAFNDRLWPDGKPLIEKVFFKEFAVQ